MAGSRPDAAASTVPCFIRTAVISVDPNRAAKGRQQIRHILDPICNDMGCRAVALHAASDANQTPSDD